MGHRSALGLEGSPLLDAEPVLLIDHRQAQIGKAHRLGDQGVRADDDTRLTRGEEVARPVRIRAAHGPGEELHADAERRQQIGDRPLVLAREQVRRGENRALPAGDRGRRERPRGDRSLARSHVTLQQPEHRRGTLEVGPDRVDRGHLVTGEVGGAAQAPRERGLQCSPDATVVVIVDGDRPALLPDSGAPPADHAHLEGQELVEREASECGVSPLEGRRIVRLLERLSDAHEPELRPNARRDVLRVRARGSIECGADGTPQRVRGQSGGQPVDRDDAAGVEERRAVVGLELRVVERHAVAEPAELATDDDRVAGLQPAFDVAPPEPRRIEAPGLVLEAGDGALHAAPERGLHPDLGDADPGRHELSVGDGTELADPTHLAEILIAARNAE